MKYNLLLSRMEKDDKQTLGMLSLYNEPGDLIHTFDALELTEGGNKKNTRVLAGEYDIEVRISKKFERHFILKDVEGRTYILIHTGNTYLDTRGCILVGNGLGDINKDGHLDILNSRMTLKLLLTYDITKLTIVDESMDEPIYLKR